MARWDSFTQNNPEGEGQGNVPALLRRIADTLEELGPVEVMDVVYHPHITGDGDWPNMTVYFHRLDAPA
jgi:hypothetical protein